MLIDNFRLHLFDSEPEMINGFSLCVAVCSTFLVAALPVWAAPPAPALALDKPASVHFLGSQAAELFTREVSESYSGALQFNFVAEFGGNYPVGFLHASPVPQGWSGTFWTRDGGTFMRELVHWGYLEHACLVADCLIQFAGTNASGHVAFAEYFRPGDVNKTGAEIDGHCAIIISMVKLWQRLPSSHPFRARLYDFLHGHSSPVRYLHSILQKEPLIPGANEFGPGCGLPGLYHNVVQNNLAALAFFIAADLETAAADRSTAILWRRDARTIQTNMEKYLVDSDGSWLWCIDPKTLKPDWAILNHEVNQGFGGLNGVACMYSDVLGFEPLASDWPGARHCLKTFEKLYAHPVRRQQFDKYGFWAQFDVLRGGLSSGPAYGEGYALQTMLLLDRLDMADRALHWLANTTFKAEGIDFEGHRRSPYHFFERTYSPDARGKMEFEAGCGALNLVSVTEPIKVARLIVGVDDTSTSELRILPRLPASWSAIQACNWPMLAGTSVVHGNLRFSRTNGVAVFRLKLNPGEKIPKLAVRMPSKSGWTWKHAKNVSEIELRSNLQ